MMTMSNVEQIMQMQDENYATRVGTEFGIFRIDDVKYNWVSHTQEWSVSCKECGHVYNVTGSVGRDWLRGKGRSINKCKYCSVSKKELQKNEKIKKAIEHERFLDNFIGKVVNGWTVIERVNSTFTVFCECGARRKLNATRLQSGNFACCKHPVDFSDDKFIGKRYGNLTVLKHVGGDFLVKCDCGFEKLVKCSALNRGKTTTCGRKECDYHITAMNYFGKHAELVREAGISAENEVYNYLISLGYKVDKTRTSGDYGVDLVCVGRDGKRVAIQIKNNKTTGSKTSVSAVQEVFAGGHFYDCDKFAVVSYTGYTENAITMAKKLNVLLCNEKCELYRPQQTPPSWIKHTWLVNGKEEPMRRTFKMNGWGEIDRYVGKTYEEVAQKMGMMQERKEQIKRAKEAGVSLQCIYYRMKKRGMSFDEAISAPKATNGRPKKQEETA